VFRSQRICAVLISTRFSAYDEGLEIKQVVHLKNPLNVQVLASFH